MSTSFQPSGPLFASNAKEGAPCTSTRPTPGGEGWGCLLRHVGSVALLILFLAPAALSQTPEEFLKSLIGQKLFLRHLGDQAGAKVKKKDLTRVQGSCDVAVQVRDAAWKKGTARFILEQIGTPHMPGKPSSCKQTIDELRLEITGFELNEPVDSLAASVGELLQTPEQYLTSNGVKFNPPLAPADAQVNKSSTPPPQPKILLSVDPVFSETARSEKFSGNVALKVIIGTDGRVHNPTIARSIGHGLDENALRVISMWRFEPPRQLDKPVAVWATIEVSFKLYTPNVF
jgi:TonB family protein